jgi:hypothetical protein
MHYTTILQKFKSMGRKRTLQGKSTIKSRRGTVPRMTLTTIGQVSQNRLYKFLWMTEVQLPPGEMTGFPFFGTTFRLVPGSAHSPMQSVPGSLSLGVKWPVHEADHSPSSSAEFMNAWSYTTTHLYTFMARCLIKQEIRLHVLGLS